MCQINTIKNLKTLLRLAFFIFVTYHRTTRNYFALPFLKTLKS